jgi:hypothetical protein
MKLSIAVVVLFAATVCSYALADKDASRPVGISAGQWIPLSERAGIVISDYQPGDEARTSQGLIRPEKVQRLPPPGQAALLARQRSAQDAAVLERQRSLENSARGYVDGYFMVKQSGRWIRLSVVPPPQLLESVKPNDTGGT